jgi:hypothetical protein
MSEHDFSDLYDQYPAVIAQMSPTFTSHQFILELARQNQRLYVETLHAYRQHTYKDIPAPFLCVHGILAKHLGSYPDLVEKTRDDAPSTDIFGQRSSCAEWRRSAT